MKKVVVFIVILLTAGFLLVSAEIIHVPGQYSTIQEGINASTWGDTVLVANGHYYERINFIDRNIVLTSEYMVDGDTLHIYDTIIDADTLVLGVADTGSVVTILDVEDSTAVIQGFTIKNGIGTRTSYYSRGGGGIFCGNGSAPTIYKNIITENNADRGGGIELRGNGRPVVRENIIRGNDAGGIYCYESQAVIQ